MSFKGDLSTIGLAEVFQMISMAGKEGTLVVRDAESRKCIYFGQTGVQLISTGRRKGLRIGDLLVRAGKLSEYRLREVLENQQITKKLLGEALVESGYVTEQDIQDVVRAQIEEEIYDLFLWKKANFDFIEGSPPAELLDADAHATKLSFDVNGLLLEAVRRADEWSVINQKLPGLEALPAFDSEVSRKEAEQGGNPNVARLFTHLDGQTTVGEALDASGVPKFEGCKAIVELLDRGKLRLLPVEEVLDLGERRFAEGRRERGLRLLRAASLLSPSDPEIAVRHAVFLESDGQGQAAAAELIRAGRLLLDAGKGDEARARFQRAAELDPENSEAKQSVTRILTRKTDRGKSPRESDEPILKALARRDYARARELCEEALRGAPDDVDCRLLLLRVFYESGNRKGVDEQVRYLRSHLPEDKDEADRLRRRINDIVPPASTSRAPSRGPRRGVRRAFAIGVLAILLLLAGAAGKFEFDARKAFDECAVRADLRLRDKDYTRALQILQEFRKSTYRHSPTVRKRLDEKEAQIREAQSLDASTRSTAADVQRQKLVESIESRLRIAEKEFEDGNFRAARTAVEDVLLLLQRAKGEEYVKSNAAFARKIDDYTVRAKAAEKKIDDAIDNIRSLRRKADQLVEEGKYAEAVPLYKKLLKDYPRYVTAEDVQFPLRIRARPDGTRVTDKRRGETWVVRDGEITLRMKYKDPPLQLRFSKGGYRDRDDVTVPYDAGESQEIVLDEKLVAPGWPWTPFEQGVSWTAVHAAGSVCVVSGKSLYCIGADTSVLQWRLEHAKPIVGPPVERGGRVFYLVNQTLHVAEPAQRRETKIPLLREGVGSPGVSSDGRFAAVGTSDRHLLFLDLQAPGQEVRWQRPVPARLLGEPVVRDGTVYWCDTDGTLHAANGERELWTWGGGRVSTPPTSAGDRIYVGLRENRVVALDLGGQETWSAETAGASETAPMVSGGTVYVTLARGAIQAFPAGNGGPWTWPADGSSVRLVRSPPAMGGGRLLVATEDRVYALDAVTGRMLWYFAASARFAASPLVVGRKAYIGGGDRSLYAIELD